MTDEVQRPGSKPSKPLDEDKERERLEPGLNPDGLGDTGADRVRTPDEGNSNT